MHLISEIVVYGAHLPEQLLPGDYRSWESPEKEANVYWLFYSNIVPSIIKNFTKYLKTHPVE